MNFYKLSIDSAGTTKDFELPISLNLKNYRIEDLRRGQDDSLIVRADNDALTVFVKHKQDLWQQIGTSINNSQIGLLDFTTKPAGDLRILRDDTGGCTPQYSLGKYEPASTQWEWQVLAPQPACLSPNDYFVTLVVDSRDYVWIQTSGYLDVLSPIVNQANPPSIRYTSNNSNYQSGYNLPLLMVNGRIWSGDDKLTSLDTNATEIPQPLPDWFANIFSKPYGTFFWQFLMLGIELPVIIVGLLMRRRLRAPLANLPNKG
jgi:hypothetical protein